MRLETLLHFLRRWTDSSPVVRDSAVNRAELVFDTAHCSRPEAATLEHEVLLIAYFEVTKEVADLALAGAALPPDRAFAIFPDIHALIAGFRGQSPIEFLFAHEIDPERARRWPCLPKPG